MPSNTRGTEEEFKELKAILRSLIISSGSGLPISLLNKSYREEEGEWIPYHKFGYSNLQDFLNNIPDTLRLKYSQDSEEPIVRHVDTIKSSHITSLIAHQKKKPKPIKLAPLRSRFAGAGGGTYLSGRPTYNCRSNQARIRPSYQSSSAYRTPSAPSKPTAAPNQLASQPVVKPTPSKQLQTHYPPLGLLSQVLQKMKINNRSSQGLRKTDILTEMKYKLDSNQVAYTLAHLNAQLNLLSNLLVIQNDCIFFKDQIQTSSLEPSLKNQQNQQNQQNHNKKEEEEEEKEEEVVINVRTKIRLQKLLEQHPEGIWCSELPVYYNSEYGIDLEYNQLGFNNITEFVASYPDIFRVVQPPNTNRLMVLSRTKKLPKASLSLASVYNYKDFMPKDPEPVPIQLSAGVSERLFPEGVLKVNEFVGHHDVTALLQYDYIEVNISEIFTPSFFWITLREEKRKIRKMMDELHDFYSKLDLDAYRIPQVVLAEGLNVACTYNKMWHRGSINKVKPDGYVVVWFYDYGTVKTYNPHNLFYLHKRFSVLPSQAIACGLFNVKPVDSLSEWPRSSTNRFINKVWNVPLIAMISAVDPDTNSMMISLTDTSDATTDVHINDWMVENKLAEFGKMANRVPIQTLCNYDELEMLNIREDEDPPRVHHSRQSHKSEENDKNSKNNASSSLESMVKENMELSKETNKITHSILVGPSNKAVDVVINAKRVVVISEMSCDMQYPVQSSVDVDGVYDNNNNDETQQVYDEKQENPEDHRLGQPNNVNERSSESSSSRDLLDVINNSKGDYDFNDGTLCLPVESNVNERSSESSSSRDLLDVINNSKGDYDFNDGTLCLPVVSNVNNVKTKLSEELAPVEPTINDKNNNYSSSISPPPSALPPTTQPMYFIIKLSSRCDNRLVHVIHLDDQGWLCANEFVNAFTHFKDQRVFFKLLKFFNHEFECKQVGRDSENILFSQLDKTDFVAPRDEDQINSNVVLHLVPLKAALSILAKLELLDENVVREAIIVIRKEARNGRAEDTLYARYKNKILFDVLNVIFEYKRFRDSLRRIIGNKTY